MGSFASLDVETIGSNHGELAIREEDLTLRPDDNGRVTILDRQFLGHSQRYCLRTPSGQQLHARTPTDLIYPIGARVKLSAHQLKFFPAESRRPQRSLSMV